MPLAKPWPLDDKGNAKPNASDTPATLDYQPYTSMDWSPLRFS